jgi:hypothetical protein
VVQGRFARRDGRTSCRPPLGIAEQLAYLAEPRAIKVLEQVRAALAAQERRLSQIRERLHEAILRGTLMIETKSL